MGSISATMSFQPCMTYIRGARTNVPSVPKDHPHEATGDFGDLGNHPMKRLAILVILVVLATFALVLAAGGPQGA